ncbi:MAG: MobF family relaxase [Phycisphaerales bacterium]
MLRIHQCRSAAAAQSYFTQGLAREDYYTEGLEITGAWQGRAAERLGLLKHHNGAVERDAFAALTENIHPRTGERLTLRTRNNRTIGYDINFHAPKGVSLLHAVHKDGRIAEAFRASVRETMLEIERHAETRVRKKGQDENRLTGNLVWADFVHLTARPTVAADGPDPHLHAHCFVMNCTWDRAEESWKAAQFRGINRDAPYYEAAFHARFARRLEGLGYAIERTPKGWDLKDVPRSLIDKYSTRTVEIEAFAAEKGITDPKQKGELGARTRKAKDKTLSAAELAQRWEKRLDDRERSLLQSINDRGHPPPPPSETPSDPTPFLPGDGSRERAAAKEAVDHAIAHCFERKSALPEVRLVEQALRFGVGRVDTEDVWAEVRSRTLLSREMNGEKFVTTNEVLAQERAMLAFAVEGKGTCAPARERLMRRTPDWEPSSKSLAEDQRRAVDHVLDSTDRVIAIRGAAGVGKTTMTLEAVGALRAAGLPVTVVAPTAGASRGADGLRGKGLATADTVAKLLSDPQMQAGLKGGVLWVDEAGLLGVGTMLQLSQLAEQHDARVVVCGDARQHRPVEAGDALRVLESHGGIAPVELTTIRRQRGMYKEAVAAIADGNLDKGLDRLEKLNAFVEIDDSAMRDRAAAQDYLTALVNGKTAMIVSPTHAEGERVARAVREAQRESGMLRGEDRDFVRLRDLNWSEAQRADPAMYGRDEGGDAPALVAHFHQGAKGVVAGDRCEILGTRAREDGSLAVFGRTPRRVEVELPVEHADRFQVFAQEKISLAAGDRIRITRNGRLDKGRSRVTNGDTCEVKGFTKDGHLKIERNGREQTVPRNYGHIAYGSVSTSHAAQGKDVDLAILVQSSASFAAGSDAQFYVSVSRGKQGLRIYTDDIAELKDAVRRSADRPAAVEVADGATPTNRALKTHDRNGRVEKAPERSNAKKPESPSIETMRDAARLHRLGKEARERLERFQREQPPARTGPSTATPERSSPGPSKSPPKPEHAKDQNRRRDEGRGRERGYER